MPFCKVIPIKNVLENLTKLANFDGPR
jgi:hypothetical protein